jgi:hypothetical protein
MSIAAAEAHCCSPAVVVAAAHTETLSKALHLVEDALPEALKEGGPAKVLFLVVLKDEEGISSCTCRSGH